MTLVPYVLVFVMPIAVAGAFRFGGAGTLLPLVIMFGVVPLTDVFIGWNRHNRAGPESPATEIALRSLPLVFVATYLALLAAGLRSVVGGAWSPAETVSLTVALGLGSAIAIAVAHELMHRTAPIERLAAQIVMIATSYPHFTVEHVFGHHRNVGTPDDPATSRLGESLYAFLPRSITGGLRSAWRIEQERLARLGEPPGSVRWIARNRMIRLAAAQAATWALVLATLGPAGLLAFLGQSAVAVVLLEAINYIEHYGLVRARGEDGRWERVRPAHSWNASHRVTNWMLLNLARHSDHHAYPGRPYPDLRHHEDAPQLPIGYAAMLVVAAVPPLWFAVMDGRVRAIRHAAAPDVPAPAGAG